MQRFASILLFISAVVTIGVYFTLANWVAPRADATIAMTEVASSGGLSPVTAALSDGDDIRARFLAGR